MEIETLGESSVPGLDEALPSFEHWSYRVDSPLRPVHELVESSPSGPAENFSAGSWEGAEPMRASETLEALEALEDFQGEDEDTEDSEEFEDEDTEDSEEFEDSEEGEAGYEELGALRSAPRGPQDILRRDVDAEAMAEDEFEDEDEDEDEDGEDLDGNELLSRRFQTAVIAGRGSHGRRRRIFLHRGETLVIKWR
jgi:hypothetical protein